MNNQIIVNINKFISYPVISVLIGFVTATLINLIPQSIINKKQKKQELIKLKRSLYFKFKGIENSLCYSESSRLQNTVLYHYFINVRRVTGENDIVLGGNEFSIFSEYVEEDLKIQQKDFRDLAEMLGSIIIYFSIDQEIINEVDNIQRIRIEDFPYNVDNKNEIGKWRTSKEKFIEEKVKEVFAEPLNKLEKALFLELQKYN